MPAVANGGKEPLGSRQYLIAAFLMKTRKIGVIGLGHVGAHCAYSLAIQGIADELVLVDLKEDKLKSEVQDLRDALMYCPHDVKINGGTYADVGDCDIIINAIGDIDLVATSNRLDEMNFSAAQVKGYVKKVMASGFNGYIINITNPCDVITDIIYKESGLPKNKVFGTGTGLDTSRLVSQLSMQTGVSPQSISAYMIGEHGASQMAAWSCVSFGGVPLSVLEKTDERFAFDKPELQKKAIGGGWVTYAGKHCTEYGICSTAARIARCILHNEKRIMPASTLLDGEYGEKNVFVGVPCLIGENGIERIMELPLTAEEKEQFHSCCEDVRKNIQTAAEIPAAKL